MVKYRADEKDRLDFNIQRVQSALYSLSSHESRRLELLSEIQRLHDKIAALDRDHASAPERLAEARAIIEQIQHDVAYRASLGGSGRPRGAAKAAGSGATRGLDPLQAKIARAKQLKLALAQLQADIGTDEETLDSMIAKLDEEKDQ